VACGIAGLVVIVAAIVMVVGLIIWPLARSSDDRPAPAPKATKPTRTAAANPPALAGAAASPSAPAPPATGPTSLDGTDADGAVTADAAGRLVIDLELRRLFDHFLAASGEEPITAIRARIVAVLRARLPGAAAAEGTAILDRYLGYRDAARQLLASGSAPASATAALETVHDLRVHWLSPAVAKVFFADEEAATLAALARHDVLADRALPVTERDQRLAEIDARTPPADLEARAAALAPVTELAQETALRRSGAGADQIAALRTAQLGPAAAARLAELDRSHAEWDARLAQFRAARAELRTDPRLDAAERHRRIDELTARSFTPAERNRVEALDRISSQASDKSGRAGAR
jgi:lipase chaperone LimK